MEIGLALDPAWRGLQPLVDEIASEVADRIRDDLTQEPKAVLNKQEAIEFTRLAKGTFEKRAADGTFRGHGGKTKVYLRKELEEAIKGL
jgi:hypothetical protein